MFSYRRPQGLLAGQADGCQPRSLEILHVRESILGISILLLTLLASSMQSYDSAISEKMFKRGEILYKTVGDTDSRGRYIY